MTEQMYAPVLKWKAGEKTAIEKLEPYQKEKILPILEIVDFEDPLRLLEGISNHFGRPTYVDTSIIDSDNREYLTAITKLSYKPGLNIYPVINVEDISGNIDSISSLASRIAIRIPFPEPIDSAPYQETFSTINNWKEKNESDFQLDIILDLDYIESKQKASILLLELKNTLRRYVLGNLNLGKVIISMTTFPTLLTDIEAGSDASFERYELDFFNRIYIDNEFLGIKDQLLFSDYGVTRFTESEIDFSKLKYGILPKARYTTRKMYWVHKGQKDTKTKKFIRSSKDIANYIFSSPNFYGQTFSFGDADIKERALGNKGPGNSKDWVTIAANHHIVVVLSELSNPPGS